MLKFGLLCLAGILSVFSISARADDEKTSADIRCLVIVMKMQDAKDEALRNAGLLGSLYFLGRLDGREPSLDIENRLIDELSRMTSAEFKSEATRCGTMMTARGEAITEMGKDMIRRGNKMLKDQKSGTTH